MNGELLRAVQAQHPVARATLDMDATQIETHKREALYCYNVCSLLPGMVKSGQGAETILLFGAVGVFG